MQCFQGKSVYKGIVLGPVVVLKKERLSGKKNENRGSGSRDRACGESDRRIQGGSFRSFTIRH